MTLLVVALPFCPPLQAQDNPLVQRGVPAEATAENAVAAREQAHANARRIAFQRMTEAMGAHAGTPSDAQLERMVAALIVETERTSSTRYIGRLTVQFSPRQVASVTGRSVSSPGGSGGSVGVDIPMAAQSYVEAQARFGSLQEWLELRRRLRNSNSVSSMDIVAISTDAARMRLGLRQQRDEAAALLNAAGLAVIPEGAGWQVGLSGS